MTSVAVVVPARNAQATIGETLASLIACTGVTQIVVVDDGSTDETRKFVSSVSDPRIQIVSGPGTGIADALNTGFAAVDADYVARCDADDLFPPDRLRWQLPVLQARTDVIAVSGGFSSILEKGTPCGDLACDGDIRDVTEDLRQGRMVTSFCTWLTRTDVLRRSGGARGWFRTAEDLDLQFRLAELGAVIHIPRIAYVYRLHDTSIVHSTAMASRAFFDRHATLFCAQRRETGSDALQRGEDLPSPPTVTGTVSGRVSSAVHQGVGHAVASAWSDALKGRRRLGLRRLLRLLPEAPMNPDLWRNILKIFLFTGRGRS